LGDGTVLAQVISTGVGVLQGMSVSSSGEFWVIAGAQVAHLSSTGTVLGSFAVPSSDPRGLSYVE
jgi:sugar lactone lactonase YvrE